MNTFQRRLHGEKVRPPVVGWTQFVDLTDRQILALHEKAYKNQKQKPFRVAGNNKWLVQIFGHECEWGRCERALVQRTDGKPVRSWHEIQRLKNEVWSPKHVALEVYPSVRFEMESYGIYWLWVFPPDWVCPIEWREVTP